MNMICWCYNVCIKKCKKCPLAYGFKIVEYKKFDRVEFVYLVKDEC